MVAKTWRCPVAVSQVYPTPQTYSACANDPVHLVPGSSCFLEACYSRIEYTCLEAWIYVQLNKYACIYMYIHATKQNIGPTRPDYVVLTEYNALEMLCTCIVLIIWDFHLSSPNCQKPA